MDGGFATLGLMLKLLPLIGILIPLLIVFVVFRTVFNFKNNVFSQINRDVFEKINQAPKSNRSYVKTKCDHCGAKCTGNTEISPSGDIKCSYCDTWFNVLRT